MKYLFLGFSAMSGVALILSTYMLITHFSIGWVILEAINLFAMVTNFLNFWRKIGRKRDRRFRRS